MKITKLEISKFRVDEDISILDCGSYHVGEEVAIAQSYRDCGYVENDYITKQGGRQTLEHTAGWSNKMFVKAKLMPHHIRISNVRVERLQDISEGRRLFVVAVCGVWAKMLCD